MISRNKPCEYFRSTEPQWEPGSSLATLSSTPSWPMKLLSNLTTTTMKSRWAPATAGQDLLANHPGLSFQRVSAKGDGLP